MTVHALKLFDDEIEVNKIPDATAGISKISNTGIWVEVRVRKDNLLYYS